MSHSIKLSCSLMFLVVVLAACVPASPASTSGPIVSTIPAMTPTPLPIVSTIPALTETPQPTPTLPPAAPTVLPAPLYYLAPGDDATQQIWRIETDGTTRTQITQEAADISDFDVSARDGSLAYLSGNALITTDGQGNNRSVLVQGPTLAPERDESYYTTEVTRPRWSPDGSRLAYGLNGINLIDATGGASTALLPNDPIPGPNDPMTQTANLYWPHNWSPDGSRMLIEIGYYRSEGSLGVLNLADNSVAALSSPAGYVCCAPAWADNNRTIIYANPVDGIVPPGLWRTDVTTGEGETLINGIAKDAVLSMANVFPTANGEPVLLLRSHQSTPRSRSECSAIHVSLAERWRDRSDAAAHRRICDWRGGVGQRCQRRSHRRCHSRGLSAARTSAVFESQWQPGGAAGREWTLAALGQVNSSSITASRKLYDLRGAFYCETLCPGL